MTRKRQTEEQLIGVLKEAQAGISVQDLCRMHGISDATFYTWRATYSGLEVSDVKKLRQLKEENRRLKQIMAEHALAIQALKAITAKTGKAQGETARRHVSGGPLWAEPTPGVSIRNIGSEHVEVPPAATGGQQPAGEDARDGRDQAALRMSAHLCAAGRRDGES